MKALKLLLSLLLCLFIAVFVLAISHYLEQQNKEKQNTLAKHAKVLFENVEFNNLGSPIYEKIESNVQCNEAYFTAVYITNDNLNQKCKEISEKMISKGWEIVGNQDCREIKRKGFNYFVFKSLLRKSSWPEIDHFTAVFFHLMRHTLFLFLGSSMQNTIFS